MMLWPPNRDSSVYVPSIPLSFKAVLALHACTDFEPRHWHGSPLLSLLCAYKLIDILQKVKQFS